MQRGTNIYLPGGGLYSPNKDQIAAMRRDIDRNPRRIRDVLSNKVVNKEFLQNVPRAGKDPISAFIQKNQRGALSTTPKVCSCLSLLHFCPRSLDTYADAVPRLGIVTAFLLLGWRAVGSRSGG